MFSMPKKALYKPISRRKFLELGGGVATVLGAGSIAVGMNSVITRRPVYAYSSDEAKWRQYEGSKLVFMSENTPPSSSRFATTFRRSTISPGSRWRS